MSLVLKSSGNRRSSSRAFTLVELMVVVALASTLAALLLPALGNAKEKSRRTVCKSNMRQFWHACYVYATENMDQLPNSADNHGHPQTIFLSNTTYSNLLEYTGGESKIFQCPNVVYATDPVYDPKRGHLIGYNYLAEMDSSVLGAASGKGVDFWMPPKTIYDSPTNTLLADANYWNTSNSRLTIAPHTSSGGIVASAAFGRGLPGKKSADLGAEGGNVALLDGSITWKPMANMRTYPTSSSDDQTYGNW